jgi:hypothetical protein
LLHRRVGCELDFLDHGRRREDSHGGVIAHPASDFLGPSSIPPSTGDRVPNPFVLAQPWDSGQLLPAGGEVALRLILIGQAIEHAAFARQAVSRRGCVGSAPTVGR